MKNIEIYLKEVCIEDFGLEDAVNGENLMGLIWDNPNFEMQSSVDAVRKLKVKEGKPFVYSKRYPLSERRIYKLKCENYSEISVLISSVISPTDFEKLNRKIFNTTGKTFTKLYLKDYAAGIANTVIDTVFADPEDVTYSIGKAYIPVNESELPDKGAFILPKVDLVVPKDVTKEVSVPVRRKNAVTRFKKETKTVVKAGVNGYVQLQGIVY